MHPFDFAAYILFPQSRHWNTRILYLCFFIKSRYHHLNIQFCSFGNLRKNRLLSFASQIILSLVEVLFIQMLFLHLIHCHTAYIPKNLVVFRILPENSIFLNSHLLMFLPTYRKRVQKYLLQIHLNIWRQNYFQ